MWESGPTGPFDHWPAFSGFEKFYGFIGGETNQWTPALIDGVGFIEPPDDPDYHLMPDLADKAIDYINQQKALTPDKPFFVYFAPGATHAPHHVPTEWIAKHKGKYDQGWDALREETFERQKALGVIAADAVLTERSEGIPSWDSVPDERRPILAHQMEVYGAFLEYADHHTGRVIDAIDRLDLLDDTLVLYIIGDNGASAEGGLERRVHALDGGQRRCRVRDRRVLAGEPRQDRRTRGVQPLRGRLGARDVHALPVDEAGREPLRRHPQRHDRALAVADRGAGRGSRPVAPCDRRRPDDPRARGSRPAAHRQRRHADPHARHVVRLLVQRQGSRRASPHPVLRDHGQPRNLPPRLDGADAPPHALGRRERGSRLLGRRVGAL